MWDLEQIIRQNDEAALDYMMRGQQVNAVQSPQPEEWPLSLLARKLGVGPPLLSELIEILQEQETAEQFLLFVRKFMPEHELEIMRERRDRRVYRFGYLFSKKYYPLPINTECGIGTLLESMPVELLGLSYASYHELNMRPGYLLLLSLVIYPFEGDWRDDQDDPVPFTADTLPNTKYKPTDTDKSWVRETINSLAIGGKWIAPMGFSMVKTGENSIELEMAVDNPEIKETIARTLIIANRIGMDAKFTGGRTSDEKICGARIPLLDTVKSLVGEELASMVPKNGWLPDAIHQMTDKTKYEGVADFGDWVCKLTRTILLDHCYEDCSYMEGYGEPTFLWTERNVKTLTEEWTQVQRIRDRIDHIVDWLEEDQVNRFKELLEFMLSNQARVKDVKPYRFDATENMCPLDQRHHDEDEEVDL